MKELIVIDVNETMLDVSALNPQFERVFGNQSARISWFSQVLQGSFVSTITNSYHHFGEIAGAALEMTALREGVNLSAEDRTSILSGIRNLPPYPDIIPGLEKMKDQKTVFNDIKLHKPEAGRWRHDSI